MRVVWATKCRKGVTPYGVVRVALAAVLLLAAGLKGHQLATEPVPGTGILDSRWFLIAVVEFELFLGLWLLANLRPKWTRPAALACFGLFAAVSLQKALSGAATCGCFGRVEVNPWFTFTLDAAAVLALLRWRPRGLFRLSCSENGAVPSLLRATGMVLVWLAVGVPAGMAMASYRPACIDQAGGVIGDSKFVILEPETWGGKRFPLLNHIDIRERLAQGNWIVVLYHRDCPRCQEAIPKYEQLARELAADSDGRQVALVEIPPYGNSVTGESPSSLGHLDETREWFVTTPLEIRLEGGVVVKIAETEEITESVDLQAASWSMT